LRRGIGQRGDAGVTESGEGEIANLDVCH
jgi:hypothetical protein